MPEFGDRSKANLESCHMDLILVANKAIELIDFMVIEGYRDKGRQDMLVRSGKSRLIYPYSAHNAFPSLAFDFIPWPFDGSDAAWADTEKFKDVANVIAEEGNKLGIQIFWGGLWRNLGDDDHVQLTSKDDVPYPKTYKDDKS